MIEQRAYEIMFRFLEDRYFRLHSDDIGALLGGLVMHDDGKPRDPAITRDWELAVRAIEAHEDAPRSERPGK
jgi:hypothetical protein